MRAVQAGYGKFSDLASKFVLLLLGIALCGVIAPRNAHAEDDEEPVLQAMSAAAGLQSYANAEEAYAHVFESWQRRIAYDKANGTTKSNDWPGDDRYTESPKYLTQDSSKTGDAFVYTYVSGLISNQDPAMVVADPEENNRVYLIAQYDRTNGHVAVLTPTKAFTDGGYYPWKTYITLCQDGMVRIEGCNTNSYNTMSDMIYIAGPLEQSDPDDPYWYEDDADQFRLYVDSRVWVLFSWSSSGEKKGTYSIYSDNDVESVELDAAAGIARIESEYPEAIGLVWREIRQGFVSPEQLYESQGFDPAIHGNSFRHSDSGVYKNERLFEFDGDAIIRRGPSGFYGVKGYTNILPEDFIHYFGLPGIESASPGMSTLTNSLVSNYVCLLMLRPWGGSCAGLSEAIALSYIGDSEILRRGHVNSFAELPEPYKNSSVLSLIQCYHLMVGINYMALDDDEIYISTNSVISHIISDVEKQGIALLGFSGTFFKDDKPVLSGHALLATEVTGDVEQDDGVVRIKLYDVNSTGYFYDSTKGHFFEDNNDLYMYVTKKNGKYTDYGFYDASNYIRKFEHDHANDTKQYAYHNNESSQLRYYNIQKLSMPHWSNLIGRINHLINICTSGNIAIQDKTGSFGIYDGSFRSGGSVQKYHRAEEITCDSDGSIVQSYLVSLDDGTIVATPEAGEYASVTLASSSGAYTGGGKGVETISIDESGVSLEGSDFDFEIASSTDAETSAGAVKVTGKSFGDVSAKFEDGKLEVDASGKLEDVVITVMGGGETAETLIDRPIEDELTVVSDGDGTDAAVIVDGATLSSATISAIKTQAYTGKAIKPKPKVTLSGVTLKLGRDYKLSYKNNVNTGTATVTATGIGAFTGKKTVKFKIYNPKAKSLAKAKLSAIKTQTYAGKALTPKPTVKLGKTKLKLGRDYTLSYKNNARAGAATVVVTGMNKYKGSVKKKFKVVGNLAKAKVTFAGTGFAYTGKPVKPAPQVKLGTATLRAGRDYTLSYQNNTKIGTASVVVKAKSKSYKGSKKATFKIGYSLASATVTLPKKSYAYTGEAVKPSPKVRVGSITLKAGTDYIVEYASNKNPGTAYVTVKGKGKAFGSKRVAFSIVSADVSLAEVSLSQTSFVYNGTPHEPTVYVKLAGKTLAEGKDYEVTYANNTNAGKATVRVAGTGTYAGESTATFVIELKRVSSGMVTLEQVRHTYTGDPIRPKATVSDGELALAEGTDYTLDYEDNTNAGTAKLIVRGAGNYTGETSVVFNIVPASIEDATIALLQDSYEYTGNAIEPEPDVTLNGRTLVKNTDYEVSYDKNVNEGTATIKVSGAGNYTGAATTTFTIYLTSPRIVQQGTSGTCSWSVDTDGLLRIWPTDGEAGQLERRLKMANGSSYTVEAQFPWTGSISNQIKSIRVESGVKACEDISYLFYRKSNLTTADLSGLDTSGVTNMSNLFGYCDKLEEITWDDIDSRAVMDMSQMLWNCNALRSVDMSSFETPELTNLENAFGFCESLTSLDLSSFDTSNVTNMGYLFSGCTALKSVNVSSFDTSKVTEMLSMFEGCEALEELDLSSFDTRQAPRMYYYNETYDITRSLLWGCTSLRSFKVGSLYDTALAGALPMDGGSWISEADGVSYTTDEIAGRHFVADTYTR